MNLLKKIRLCEVGLRDGLQNECSQLSTEQKVEIANMLTEAGYPIIEVGSFVSPKAVPQMADTDEIFKRMKRKDGTEYRALIVNDRGVDRAIACGCKKVKLNVSASRAHNLANLNCTPAESVAKFKVAVDKAQAAGIEVSGSISMPFASPWETEITIDDVRSIVQAYIDCDVTEISLSDASGMAHPKKVYTLCKAMKDEFPQVTWILHFHNTRGMAMANVIAGMQAGIDCYDVAFAGLGGCPFVPGAAGNLAAEDALHMLDEMEIETGVDLQKVIQIGKKVAEIVNHPINSCVLKAGRSKDLIKDIPVGQAKNETQLKK